MIREINHMNLGEKVVQIIKTKENVGGIDPYEGDTEFQWLTDQGNIYNVVRDLNGKFTIVSSLDPTTPLDESYVEPKEDESGSQAFYFDDEGYDDNSEEDPYYSTKPIQH